MKLQEFRSLINNPAPPPGMNDSLTALWYDAKGNWNKAHELAQGISDLNGAWIHAYLHRREGDDSNARYWYSRAGKEFPKISLDEEWDMIVIEQLKIRSNIV